MSEITLHDLEGRTHERSDVTDPNRWRDYQTFFGLNFGPTGPLALHWLLFNELSREQRSDGHPVRMDPFPELPFPRRMWAGGEITWIKPITPGQELTKATVVSRAELKSGSAGQFLLTSLRHVLKGKNGRYIQERQDIVFLPADSRPGGGPHKTAPFKPEWKAPRLCGPIELFRYSALTLNSHRIHYDVEYATSEEGYPSLVVQGPLLASHLMHASAERRPSETPLSFSYRSVAPVFVSEPFQLVGRRRDMVEELAILGPEGRLCMTAEMTFRENDAAVGLSHEV